ncbi:hypothetical protein [Pseudanabaena sp. PCC 6802]|uniref:hypothetical protein n=1 Tax=Pseudanabaena sp. PCC 6802 TaxID=118173 RepID=UPI00034CD96D|nr:hypothetical protein [Pseudanabaena sp. PCC 6802]
MSTEFNFDESCWYSGCDDTYLAELLPAHPGYWFVVLLGRGYLATSDRPFPRKNIVNFLAKHGFVFDLAIWESVVSDRFTQNPFLSKTSARRAIAVCQTGKHQLPQRPAVVEFGQNTETKPKSRRRSQVCFILTADREFLHVGTALDPHSSLQKLQAAYPQTLNLIGSLPDRRKLGQTIHQQFGHLNTQGNWFRYSQELQAHIASLLAT